MRRTLEKGVESCRDYEFLGMTGYLEYNTEMFAPVFALGIRLDRTMSDVIELQKASIKRNFERSTISAVQLNPNSACNSRCWYCPVAYEPQPYASYGSISPESLERIISQLALRDGTIVNGQLDTIQVAHYNEILLYPRLKEMLELFRKYRFSTMILSNGRALTREKARMIVDYSDVVRVVYLNVPAGNDEDYSRYTGSPRGSFEKLVDNIQFFLTISRQGKCPPLSIGVDGLLESGTNSKLMAGAPADVTPETSRLQREQLAELFPKVEICISPLMDRAGELRARGILDSSSYLPSADKVVIGCNDQYGDARRVPDRIFEWAHINARGDMFLCCNDYGMHYSYGNCLEKPIKELWHSQARLEMIMRAANGLCRKCSLAVARTHEELAGGRADWDAHGRSICRPPRASLLTRLARKAYRAFRLLTGSH